MEGAPFRLLVWMALAVRDGEERPRCELSRQRLAEGLGYPTLTKTADRAVHRAVSSLMVVGALEVAQTKAPGRRAHYWLNLSMEKETDLSPNSSTVVVGIGDRSVGGLETDLSPITPSTLSSSSQEVKRQEKDFAPQASRAPDPPPLARRPRSKRASTGQPALWPAAAPPTPTVTTPSAVTAQTIIGEWIDRCAKRPPGRVVGHVAKLVGEMLDEGMAPDDLRRGMAEWMTKGLHPAALPSVVNEVMNGRTGPSRRRSTTDERFEDAVEQGRQLQALADRKAVGA